MRRILALASLLAFCGGAAADTRKGYEAYTGGDFKTAVQEFRASAQQGDALAMFYLGECYYGSKLAPDQLAKAQDLARNWQPRK